MYTWHALGHQVGGLVVVGDHHIDALRHDVGHFNLAGNTAVNRDDDLGIELANALERHGGKAVALVETPRDERRDMAAQRAQAACEHGSCRDAVNVEVAVHHDMLVLADGGLKSIGHFVDLRDKVWVKPIALKRGRQKSLRLLDGGYSPACHSGRDEMRQSEMPLQLGDDMRIRRADVELRRHEWYLVKKLARISRGLFSHNTA